MITQLGQSTVIFFSFVAAWVLMLLPMPYSWDWIRPEWLTLVLIYWIFFSSRRISIVMAWSMGLMMDVLNNGLLGQYALTMVVVAYLARLLRMRIRLFPFWQQAFVILLLVAFGNFTLLLIQWLIGRPTQTSLYGISTISSVLLWPWIYRMLRFYERKVLG